MVQITKHCISCNTKFQGRQDAKTCSDTCRKRLQRLKAVILNEAGVLRLATSQAIADNDINPSEDDSSNLDDLQWQPAYLELPSSPDTR